MYKGSSYKVLSCQKCKDDYYKYYIQNFDDKSVVKVPEAEAIAAFNNGQVDPCVQLKKCEFQNPAWYLGRAVVAKSMDILENSIYGFKELAGSKIYLMPHQVNTIMRCLQESPCRYMLADEVGMGKTIEAISVYKIYTMNQSNKKALIVVPQALKEQWISELLLKFNIPNGMGKNNNSVTVKTLQELREKDLFTVWDFVIVDEVHKYLFSQSEYEKLHKISTLAKNILLLSATPVQQKKEEYLDLLRLLLPQKYNFFSVEKFGKLIAKQSKIIQKTALILDDLGDFEEEINSLTESDENAHDSEECEELFEEIYEDLEEIWACASLLHVHKEVMAETIYRLARALKHDGIFYASWKYGDGEHYDNGRLFSDYKQESMKSLLLNVREVMLIEIWKTEDVRLEKRNSFAWINVIAKKV